jgi:hypothetical protein
MIAGWRAVKCPLGVCVGGGGLLQLFSHSIFTVPLVVLLLFEVIYLCYFSEAIRVQSTGVYEALHGPQLAEEAREDGPRGGLLYLQEAQR